MKYQNEGQHRSPWALIVFLALSMAVTSPTTRAQSSDLPSIGGSGGLISGQMEADIGQQVMASIRRSAPQLQDPLP